MSLAAPADFGHLQASLSDRSMTYGGTGGEVVLREKYFPVTGVRAKTRKIRLLLPGPGLAFELDHDQVDLQRRKSKSPLLRFLDNTAKPWSRRCAFVTFDFNGRAFHADCIEFKSKSLRAGKIMSQLKAGTSWVNALTRTIEQSTGDKPKIRLLKVVFAENENRDPYIGRSRQLRADPSIRYHHLDEVQGQPLADPQNTSVQEL